MNTGDGACVSELAALGLCGLRVPWRLCGLRVPWRLCGLRVPWRFCGFAACAFHGGFAALRLARSMAALRLCGFDALQGARVYPNPRAMLSCSFDSSHSFEIFSLSLDSCWLSFEVLLSFLSALFSFQALSFVQVLSCSFDSSHSFEILSLSFVQALSCFVRLLTFVCNLSLSLDSC